ncbi:MAG: Gldg family protein [Candidatus Krumholzibacteriota bacterium]|nr:Gldg family protein [Candidatus Krumholzibacteriota bacterium]
MGPRAKWWLHSLLRVAALLALGAAVVFLAGRHRLRWDVSPDRIHTLPPQAEAVLDSLSSPLSITLFLPDREPERSRAAALLGAAAAGRPRISWELVDPGQHPRRALAAGIKEPGSILLEHEGRREIFVAERDAAGGYLLDEAALTRALRRVTQARQIVARVVQGPGLLPLDSGEGLVALKLVLKAEGYAVEAWQAVSESQGGVPAGTDLLILAGPRRGLPAFLVAGLEAWLDAGGSLLLLLDPDAEMADGSFAANLEPLLARRGIHPGRGFVIDLGEANINMDKGFEVPVVSRYAPHPITLPFLRLPALTAFPVARPFAVDSIAAPLLYSSPRSFEELDPPSEHVHFDEGRERGGPLVLAAASESGGGRLVVVGDSHFVRHDQIDWQGNADLLLNAAAWLVQERDAITPRERPERAGLLRMGRAARRVYGILILAVMPGLLLALWPLRLLLARRRPRPGGAP